jgi:hypothetical protein
MWLKKKGQQFFLLNDVRRPFEPQVAMCRAKKGELLTNKNQVLVWWKEQQPTRPVDLRDDGVDIDFPNREEIENLEPINSNKLH